MPKRSSTHLRLCLTVTMTVALLQATPWDALARPPRVAPPGAHGRPGAFVPITDPTGHALDAFRTAMGRAARRKGQVRIAFYGASHTAADLWTGELRRLLQDRVGDAGHGFVFPVRWNVGYRHQDLVVESSAGWRVDRHRASSASVSDLGVAGLAMTSNDPLEYALVRTTRDSPYGALASRVTLWFRTDVAGGDVAVDIDGKVSIVTTRAAAAGVKSRTWSLHDEAHTIRFSPVGNGVVTLFGLALDRGVPGAIVDQLGIPGMRAEIVLHWNEAIWKQMLHDRAPDLVVLAYGTNDVGDVDEPAEVYASTWRQVLGRVRNALPGAACLIVGPTDRLGKDGEGNRRTMPRTPSVIATQQQVAAEFGCGHWDAQATMGGPGAMVDWQRAGLAAADDVHLKRDGYGWLAELLAYALLREPGAAQPQAYESRREAVRRTALP